MSYFGMVPLPMTEILPMVGIGARALVEVVTGEEAEEVWDTEVVTTPIPINQPLDALRYLLKVSGLIMWIFQINLLVARVTLATGLVMTGKVIQETPYPMTVPNEGGDIGILSKLPESEGSIAHSS